MYYIYSLPRKEVHKVSDDTNQVISNKMCYIDMDSICNGNSDVVN
jgi:hypothetical protein